MEQVTRADFQRDQVEVVFIIPMFVRMLAELLQHAQVSAGAVLDCCDRSRLFEKAVDSVNDSETVRSSVQGSKSSSKLLRSRRILQWYQTVTDYCT